ncbi:MAG: hypothetical protein ABR596_04300 [Halarsenatibacteraceae bacterium]
MKNNDYSLLLEGQRRPNGANVDLKLEGIEYYEDVIYSLESILLKFTDMIDYNMIGQVFFMLSDIYDLTECDALRILGDYAENYRFDTEYDEAKALESA